MALFGSKQRGDSSPPTGDAQIASSQHTSFVAESFGICDLNFKTNQRKWHHSEFKRQIIIVIIIGINTGTTNEALTKHDPSLSSLYDIREKQTTIYISTPQENEKRHESY